MTGRTNNPSHGTKVTDPNAPKIREGAGAVASDSLAAESEGFSQNRNGEAMGVSGSNSTLANQDTSNAHKLHPASDAEARMAQDDWAEEKKLSSSFNDSSKSSSNAPSEGLGGSGATAPSYVNSQYGNVSSDGPKGQNIEEGGFEPNDYKNASFNQAVGGKNDPGRVAEDSFAYSNSGSDAFSAGQSTQKGSTGGNTYDELSRDESA